eukprot:377400-Hanusia_phi.AAC.2
MQGEDSDSIQLLPDLSLQTLWYDEDFLRRERLLMRKRMGQHTTKYQGRHVLQVAQNLPAIAANESTWLILRLNSVSHQPGRRSTRPFVW